MLASARVYHSITDRAGQVELAAAATPVAADIAARTRPSTRVNSTLWHTTVAHRLVDAAVALHSVRVRGRLIGPVE